MQTNAPTRALVVCSLSLSVFISASLHVSAATVDGFGFGWKFAKGDQQTAIAPNFDDSKWEHVDLPHDWAIYGPFGPLNESGLTGKLPWSGEGWYRKQSELPATVKGQRVQLLFDMNRN